nr:ATP-binding protein [Actinomycetota bacterium]
NVDIAVDVAAMATAGGTLIYGIGEDSNKRPELHPIELAGARERVASIVQASLAEAPALDIRELRLESDPSQGYLVVHVPPSPLAPHMVQVKGHYRYYGRNEAGNYVLPHDQVVALIERRRRLENGWENALEEAIREAPDLSELDDFVPLDLVFIPLLGDEAVLDRAWPAGVRTELFQAVTEATNALRFAHPGDMTLTSVIGHGPVRRVDGWLIYSGFEGPTPSTAYAMQLEVHDSGRMRLFCAGVARTYSTSAHPAPIQTAREYGIARLVAQAAFMAGHLYRRGGYSSYVDGAVSIRNAGKVVSARAHEGLAGPSGWPYAPSDYRRGGRWPAASLEDDPRGVALQLVGPWLRALMQTDPAALLTFPGE